jgi:hypothetical protein
MLWFDDGPQGLKDKVARAVSFYATKYGRSPTVCLVHPATYAGAELASVSGVALRETHAILPNHFLVGIEEQPAVMAGKRPARKASPERSRGASPAPQSRGSSRGAVSAARKKAA